MSEKCTNFQKALEDSHQLKNTKSTERSEVDKAIDNISGSIIRNERAGAIIGAAVTRFFVPTAPSAGIGAQLGASSAHGAQQAEKELHKAGKDLSKLNPCKRW